MHIENIPATALTTVNEVDMDMVEDDGFITVYPPMISFYGKAENNQSPEYTRSDSRQNRCAAECSEQDANN